MTTVTVRFEWRKDVAADWAAANPVPLSAEPCWETDTKRLKIGDGTTPYNSLPYFGETDAELVRDTIAAALQAGSGITITPNDGSDTITVSSSITQYTDEMAQDAIAAMLAAGTGISVSYNDAANTYTITATGTYTDENARDAIGTALTGGEGVAVSVDDGADTITVRAGNAAAYPGSSGNYYLNLVTTGTLSTIATAADRFDFYPLIPLANDLTISALALYVTTGVASAKSRLGIYADNGGKPDGGALICDSGELDCATSATGREGAVSVTLQKGKRYWLAVLSNSTQTLRSMPTTVLPLGVGDLSGTAVRNMARATYTYGALPSTAPTTSRTNGTQVAIGLKIA